MRILRSIPFVAWVACVGLCAIAAGGAPARAATSRSDVPVVHNPAEPARGDWEIRAVEQWRAGGEDDTVLFGAVADVDVAPDGTTYLLDTQQSTVHVIGPDGRYLRRIGRAGEGPGEFTFPISMCIDGDGNVCVVAPMMRRIVRLTSEGQPLDPCDIPSADSSLATLGAAMMNMSMVADIQFAGGAFVMQLQSTRLTGSTLLIRGERVRARCDGTILARYAPTVHEATMSTTSIELDEQQLQGPLTAVGSDGRVFVCDSWSDYRILVLAPDGRPERVIERDFEPLPRTDEERARAEETLRGQMAVAAAPTSVHVSDVFRSVAGMLPREDGSLWVVPAQRPESLPEGVAGVYDEFDREGRFVRSVYLVLDVSTGRDGVFLANDRVVVVRGLSAISKSFVASLQPSAAETLPDDDEGADTSEDGTVIGYVMGRATRRATH